DVRVAAIVSRTARLPGDGVTAAKAARRVRGQVHGAGRLCGAIHYRGDIAAEPDPAGRYGGALRDRFTAADPGNFYLLLGGRCIRFLLIGGRAGCAAERATGPAVLARVARHSGSIAYGDAVRPGAGVFDPQSGAPDEPAAGVDTIGAAV